MPGMMELWKSVITVVIIEAHMSNLLTKFQQCRGINKDDIEGVSLVMFISSSWCFLLSRDVMNK